MTETEQKKAAKEFADYWKDKGYEKGQSQSFWLSLLRDVYGVEHPEQFIEFEDQVHIDNASFIDGMIPSTRVMIEQKGSDKRLDKPLPNAGQLLTPFQQAQRYIMNLPVDRHPRWVVTCNFKEFWVYDMNKPGGDPEKIKLEDLPHEYYRLQFLVDTGNEHLQREMEVSIAAGEIVGQIYDAFAKQYAEPESEHAMHSLNVLCVRLVFCLYAENSGIFGRYGMFHDYMEDFETRQMRKALIELFRILDTPDKDRDPYLADDDPKLAAFPYVNGGLFADEDIEIPPFTDEIRTLLLDKASAGFDWSEISPTIFGAVFESTLNPETRRSGGMHYTSIENIHKVIDPLFLDELKQEFDEICSITVERTRNRKLSEFQNKLSSLTFLDPACGSGNFLTETYLSLRRLENDVLRELMHGQMSFGLEGINPIQVSLNQFYGVEINDFAVTVAKTALWIAESQMMQETESIVMMDLDFLPLKSYTNIMEGNALRLDWGDVVPKQNLNYIMGNPPFVGKKYQTSEQKSDMKYVFGGKAKGIGNLDYVTAWYRKAAEYMNNTDIIAAFVSTNSIVQGEHIPLFWKPLYEQYPVTITFAYKTFKWNNEVKDTAAVHCVIMGFCIGRYYKEKWLYLNDNENVQGVKKKANNIHPYLIDMPNIFIENRSKPIDKCQPLVYGSFALDDGNYTISEQEYNKLVEQEPNITKYLKPFIGSEEFINGKKRYCIWLKDADIRDIKKSKILSERVRNVQEWRSKSGRKETVAAAATPTLFAEIRQPDSDYMAIPITSSERRRYIPIGYMTKDIIASNHLLVLPNATLYEFGILTSNVHMAWMRTVAGRLEMRYNYSARIVYNNFPWPKPSDEQKDRIEQTAQQILNARSQYSQRTLAELYDPLYMPKELLKAHQLNDKAVMDSYGWTSKDEAFHSETACVSELMKLYKGLVDEEQSK